MNWYKKAQMAETQLIHTLQDRNRINAKIHHLERIAEILTYAAKLIHQTQRGARSVVQDIMADKRLSSYPQVKNVLSDADKVAMDSPNKFASFCMQSIIEIEYRIAAFKEERRRYTNEELGKPRKGLSM